MEADVSHGWGRRLLRVQSALFVVLGLSLATGLALTGVTLGNLPAVEPIFDTAIFVMAVLTAVLLIARFAVSGPVRMLALGVGYVLAASAVLAALALLPSDRTEARLRTRLALHRHQAIVLVLLAAAVVQITLTAVVVNAGRVLPDLVDGTRYHLALRITLGVAACLNVVVILLTLIRRPVRDLVESWIVTALVSMSVNETLAMLAGRVDTVAWYLARATALVTFSLVLAALFGDIIVLYGRLDLRNRHLQAQLEVDALTGTASRSTILGRAGEVIERIREASEVGDERRAVPGSSVLAMLDLDHFKLVNDTHGHLVGDEVLAQVGRRVRAALRDGDAVGRYGGEEFLLVLAPATAETASRVCERVRLAVSSEPCTTRTGLLGVTVSIGATELVAGDGLLAAVGRADAALYAAKEAGRNPEHGQVGPGGTARPRPGPRPRPGTGHLVPHQSTFALFD